MLNTRSTFFQRITAKIFSLRAILVVLVFFSGIQTMYASNIILSPAKVSTKVGQTFTLDVLVNDNKDAINAVSALVSYPPDVLSVSSI